MRLESLEAFIPVYELRSMTKAAEQLNIERSSLSKQMKALAEAYNCELFTVDRTNSQQLCPTPAATQIYNYAKLVSNLNLNLKDELLDLKSGYTHNLHIAVSPMIGKRVYYKCILPLSLLFPSLNFTILGMTVDEQEQAVLRQSVQLGITDSSLSQPHRFEILDRKALEYYILCSKNTKLIDPKKEYSIKDLADIPISISIGAGDKIENEFRKAGIIPKIIFRNDQRELTLLTVKEDRGITIYPIKLPLTDPDLVALPLKSPKLIAEEVIFCRKEDALNPIITAFLKLYNS